MDTATHRRTEEPNPTLRLELLLRRDAPGGPWRAELALPGASGRLAFPSLDALFGYLSRLDRPPIGLR
jgi:hypothetical protein